MSKPNPITNHARVRELALHAGNQRLAGMAGINRRYTRVSQAFLDQVDAEVHALVVRRASEHWQKGQTLT